MREGEVHNYIDIRLNEEGFQDVFQRYYVSLSLFANRYVDDEEVAADIVQDVFAKLWQIRTDFFYLHQVKSFLYTSVRNKALNELEHRHVMTEYAQRVVEKQKEAFFHDAVIEQETYRVLVEAIDRLPSQMKSIMLLALEGKKNAEIAERLEISVERVHALKERDYKKHRHFLNHYYYTLLWLLCV